MLDQIPSGKGANSFRDKPYASFVPGQGGRRLYRRRLAGG